MSKVKCRENDEECRMSKVKQQENGMAKCRMNWSYGDWLFRLWAGQYFRHCCSTFDGFRRMTIARGEDVA